ncbi:Sporulation related domain-containing protein [Pseudorhodobacter antarcticus]|uniref:Sporulation related domain-containing protein n=1 Tax=Pseudorhodobacter antarcticus TaxID=1077947 RepID=A0A1H8EMW4_9RHOB|nr:SPOR domain-containing protein [Pseudorhodobacter antarcticus]SEN20825.1 Sporulation related domain-containing protein [Pseudorhodobacter antarcticus]
MFKVFAVAALVALATVSAASAQSMAGPAENPPSSFKGSQYVDSRGCVFLRAGIGGRVSWVPRISRDRKALCGPSPASAAREVAAAVAAPVVAAPVPRQAPREAVGAPMRTIASQLPRATAPVSRVQAPQRAATRVDIPLPNAVQRRKGCPASSPYGAPVTLADGRRSLMCSSNPNFNVQAALNALQAQRNVPLARSATQAYAPQIASGNDGYTPRRPAFGVRGGVPQGVNAPRVTAPTYAPTAANDGYTLRRPSAAAAPVVPKGYIKAWKDDRLNPNRGIGTRWGEAQQDQVWTRDVPAQLTADQPVKRRVYATSASNAPQRARGGYYVQVGTFGEAGNAARSVGRLQGMGLPVTKSRITNKGRAMQIVMAGPFGDAGSAQAALSQARRSGFGDAFIR